MKRDNINSVDLSPADPGAADPGYWNRFHHVVTTRAMAGLSRRRREVGMSVTDLVLQWGRAAVPLAATAAVLAGLTLLNQPQATPTAPVALEEILSQDPDGVDLTGLSLQQGAEAAQLAGAEW